MSMVSLLEWIESTDLSTAIREGALSYPIIGGVHLLGIALFGGMLLMTDLRLLGWAMQRRPVSDIVQQFVVEVGRLCDCGGQRFASGLVRAVEALSQPRVLGQNGPAGSGGRACSRLSRQGCMAIRPSLMWQSRRKPNWPHPFPCSCGLG